MPNTYPCSVLSEEADRYKNSIHSVNVLPATFSRLSFNAQGITFWINYFVISVKQNYHSVINLMNFIWKCTNVKLIFFLKISGLTEHVGWDSGNLKIKTSIDNHESK